MIRVRIVRILRRVRLFGIQFLILSILFWCRVFIMRAVLSFLRMMSRCAEETIETSEIIIKVVVFCVSCTPDTTSPSARVTSPPS